MLSKSFWVFRAAHFISQIGNGFGSIALAWWVLEKSSSAATMGTFFAANTILKLILTVLLSPFPDRMNRKKLTIMADILQALAWAFMSFCVFYGEVNLFLFAGIYAVGVLGSALFQATMTPFALQLAGVENGTGAVQAIHLSTATASILGAFLGGVVVARWGTLTAFTLNSISFLGSGLLCLFIVSQLKSANEKPVVLATVHPFKKWWSDICEGFVFVRSQKVLIQILIFFALYELLYTPSTILFPYLIKERLHLGPDVLGFLRTGNAVGSIAVGLCFTILAKWVRPLSLMILSVGVSACAYFMGIFLEFPFIPVCIGLALGSSIVISNLVMTPRISQITPRDYQGRVFALVGFVAESTSPVGMYLMGLALSHLNPTLVCLGMGALLLALMFILPFFKNLRELLV